MIRVTNQVITHQFHDILYYSNIIPMSLSVFIKCTIGKVIDPTEIFSYNCNFYNSFDT